MSGAPAALRLTMGCFELRLSSSEKGLLELAQDRYGEVIDSRCAARPVTPTVGLDLELFWDDGLDASEPTRFSVTREETRLSIASGALAGTLDPATGRGRIGLPHPDRRDVAAGLPAMGLENFLRISVALLAAPARCLLVHTAAVTRRDHPSAVLLHGPSGAGKSTCAALSAARDPRHRVLTDDLLLLGVPTSGAPLAHATCFWGDERPRPRPGAPAPIAGIFELEQSARHATSPMDPQEGAASLIAAIPFQGFMSRAEVTSALDLAIEVTSRVPCSRLLFRKDGEFWEAVERMLA